MDDPDAVGNGSASALAIKPLAMKSGLLAAAGCAAAAAGVLAYGVRGRSSRVFGPSIYRGTSARGSIALTFDDGPSEGSLRLLDYLDSQQIRATFFECGLNVLRHPSIARTIRSAGHEIGNHTYSHARLCPYLGKKLNLLSPKTVDLEFSRAQEVIEAEVGIAPTLLRAPYGLRWFGMRGMQARLKLLGVMWTVIGHDWEWPAERVARLVLERASPGGIICLHDGRDIQRGPDVSEMLKAIRTIVPVLRDRGYTFETVSELQRP